jgi:protein-S-isoprenylcysteine O-methyltransferase Ste14
MSAGTTDRSGQTVTPVMADDQTFRTLLLIGIATTLPIMAYHRFKAHTSEPLDRRQEGWLVLATVRPIGIAFMIALIVYAVNPARMAWAAMPLPAWIRWAGFGVLIASNALLFWTLHTLGRNLTDTVVTRKVHTLVVRGPYRWVRHPFYCSIALLILSMSLITANWFLMATGPVALAMLIVRTPIEEAKLVERFGDDYRRYMARTNRFIPTLRPRRRP